MSRQRVYTGVSGQHAVVAELLMRQITVALPMVDRGTDLFAFREESERVARIQVKTARGDRYAREEGYSAQFGIPMRQLEVQGGAELLYVLVTRLEDAFGDFVVVSRAQVCAWWNGLERFGTDNPSSGDLALTVQFRPASVLCGQVDLTAYRNAWALLGFASTIHEPASTDTPAQG